VRRELGGMSREAVVAPLEITSRHALQEAEENHGLSELVPPSVFAIWQVTNKKNITSSVYDCTVEDVENV